MTLYHGAGFRLRAAMAMTIGAVAKATNVGVQTLRYYERRGLLLPPQRTASGYRQFPEDVVRRVRFIRRAQSLGFTLEEIGELLTLRVQRGRSCAAVERTARHARDRVRQRLAEMQGFERALSRLIHTCERGGTTEECAILQAIEARGE